MLLTLLETVFHNISQVHNYYITQQCIRNKFFISFIKCIVNIVHAHTDDVQGRSQDFSKGGHTVSNIIVMAFSPRNIIGCFLKKGLQRGGHRHPRIPPRYALDVGCMHYISIVHSCDVPVR